MTLSDLDDDPDVMVARVKWNRAKQRVIDLQAVLDDVVEDVAIAKESYWRAVEAALAVKYRPDSPQ